MWIEIDVTVMPPRTELHDPDDFRGFEVRLRRSEHVFVPVDEITTLAGPRAAEPAWQEQLDVMLAYAESKGWRRRDGAVRAHVRAG